MWERLLYVVADTLESLDVLEVGVDATVVVAALVVVRVD